MKQSETKFLVLVIVILIAACIETDIYLPAFPDMMAYFAVSEETIQKLLTWNFFGICVSGPFYGPISDAVGRRKPLLVSLGLFLLGSIATVVSESFELMLWGRLLQGIGSGGCFTLGIAIFFDAFQKERAIRAVNKLNLYIPFIIALAPMLGGYLNYAFGFRSNFFVIACFVLIGLLICQFFYPETHPKEKRVPLELKKIGNDLKRAFTSAPFWQLNLVMSLLFAAYMAFLATTSLLFVLELGVSKQLFPFFQASILASWLVASITCDTAIKKWGNLGIKQAGTAICTVSSIGFAAAAWLTPENPYILTIWMMLFAFGINWIQALYFSESMEILPDIKGMTASLLTSTRLLLTGGVVGMTSKFYDGTIYPVAVAVIVITAAVIPMIVFYEKGQKALPATT